MPSYCNRFAITDTLSVFTIPYPLLSVLCDNADVPELSSIALALAGGITPALLWLWFWHREDAKNPEPKRMIALAFVMGMVTVAIVIPVQKFVAPFIAGPMLVFVAWSFIEEAVKYFMAQATVLRSKAVDEPLDMVMYMVTIALGFAAIENALFLLSPLSGDGLVTSILTGNLRFIGATLLHVLSSAVIGVALALTFYKSWRAKATAAIIGVILASILHSGFNLLILNTPNEHLLRTFTLVWVGVVAILAALEWVKRIRRSRRAVSRI